MQMRALKRTLHATGVKKEYIKRYCVLGRWCVCVYEREIGGGGGRDRDHQIHCL